MPKRIKASARRIRRLATAMRRELAQVVPVVPMLEIAGTLSLARNATQPTDGLVLGGANRYATALTSSKTTPKVLHETEMALFLMLRERLVRRRLTSVLDESAERIDWILSEEVREIIMEDGK